MLASRHEYSEYTRSGCCSDSSALVPRHGDLSGISFDSVKIWAFLILLQLHWVGYQLISLHMLCYVQAKCDLQPQHLKEAYPPVLCIHTNAEISLS